MTRAILFALLLSGCGPDYRVESISIGVIAGYDGLGANFDLDVCHKEQASCNEAYAEEAY